jgi:hypothetical protein
VKLSLAAPYFPNENYGKNVKFNAFPRSKPEAVQSGAATEFEDDRGTYEFAFDVNATGDWRIDVEAKWSDGRPYRTEWVEFRDVP